jgi:DNA polymerase-3 subunit alpha
VDADLATKLFDLVEKFAGYGFNKSHSAAYALVSYQTAWLKAHYPAHFMAAVMSSELDNTDKIVVFLEECKRMKQPYRYPDVNEGERMFTVNARNEIVYGLGAIKGLGEGPIDNILAARAETGPFADLFDFCARTDPRRVNRKAIEALINSGAFDSLGEPRWILMASLDDALRAALQDASNRESGIDDLFGEVVPGPHSGDGDVYAGFRGVRRWSDKDRLGREKDALGLWISGHPFDQYEKEIRRFAPIRIADLRADRQGSQVVAGLINATRTMKTRRGDTMAVIQLDDRSARIEVTVYAETYAQSRELLAKDQIVIVAGAVAHDDYSGTLAMRASSVLSLPKARQNYASELSIEVGQDRLDEQLQRRLEQMLAGAGGDCPVSLVYNQAHNRARVRLGDRWRVEPSDELLQSLREELGSERVVLVYS